MEESGEEMLEVDMVSGIEDPGEWVVSAIARVGVELC